MTRTIPFLDRLDIFAELKNGGGILTIITAQPLSADRRTQERLLQKIEIAIGLKPGTDPEIYDLLERSVDWVFEQNAKLVWETD